MAIAIKKTHFYRLFLFSSFITVCFISGCAGKKSTPFPENPQMSMEFSMSEEIFFVLEKLDSFDPEDRLKGAKLIADSQKLKELIKISDAVHPKDEAMSAAYMELCNEMIVQLYPAIHALFTAALDIQPDIKENAFDSLSEISSCLLKIILTTYSIKNASFPETREKKDAIALLDKAKAINEDIITFFRNEPFGENKNIADKLFDTINENLPIIKLKEKPQDIDIYK